MGPRAKKVLVWTVIAFVSMGIYKNPEVWGGNANKGIDTIEEAGESGGTFINTVLSGQ